MSNVLRKVRVGIALFAVLAFLVFIVTAYAATFINQLNTPNGEPLNTSPDYLFYVCSDTSFGEGPAIEYSVNGGPFTCAPCAFFSSSSPKCPGASVFQCKIPRQANATVQYQFFNLSSFGDCNSSRSLFTGFKSFATDANGNTTPTEAKVTDFKATGGKGGALLEWRTGFEVDNLGFNLYRERNGQRVQVNPSLIAGSALTAGPGTRLTAGRSYAWHDPQGTADSLYYLEAVDLSGETHLTGPTTPRPGSTSTKEQQATLLSKLGSAAAEGTQTEGPTALMTANAAAPVTAEGLQEQWNIAAQPAVKISVKKNDWYRVSQADLVATGLSPSANADNLQLFVDGVEQPMLVSSTNGQLAPGDFIEFYGTGLSLTETDTHVYWLVNGTTPGKRIRLIGNERPDGRGKGGGKGNGQPVPKPQQQPVVRPSLMKDEPRGSFLWTVMAITGLGQDEPGEATQRQQRAVKGSSEDGPTVIDVAPAREAPEAVERNPAPAATQSADEKPAAETAPEVRKAAAQPTAPPAAAPAQPQPSATEGTQPQVSKARARKARARGSRSRKGTARRERAHAATAAEAAPTDGEANSFPYTVELKERTVYFSSLLNGDTENFFGRVVASLPVSQTLVVSHLDTSAPPTTILEVALQGVSPQAHNVRVFLNDTEVGTAAYFFRDHYVLTVPVSPSLVREGANVVKLMTTAGGDVSIVDYIRLSYPHTYAADGNNSLRFTLRNSQTARVEGFTTPDIRLIDITNPKDVQQLRPTIEPSGNGFALVIGTLGRNVKGRRTLMAFPAAHAQQPAKLVANQPSNLNSTGQGADMVVISHRTLKQNITPLVNLRSTQGLFVSVVDVDDVFDEFGYGTHTPQAIKDFLSYATSHWGRAPRFVLLVGDSSYDPKDYFKVGDFDQVPSKLVDTLFTETASDDWLADFNGDSVPDLALGRLPARNTTDLDRMVNKIVAYDPSAAKRSALFVADAQGTYPFSFEQENRDIAVLLPSDVAVQHVDRASNPDINVVRAQLFSAINQGPLIVNYAGHGTVDAWTGASLFTNPDALNLSNGTNNGNHLPLFVMMTCLTGYYNDPVLESLSESLMRAPNGGSVAVWASSGLTVPSGQSLMNQSLYQSLFSNPSPSLGEAIQKAKAATPDTDVRLTWTLFGDPSMKIR